MPTTSNFGWTTPADTDLVKDGAAAIRTLGNGIDTSFVDLKGGTTNQVLAKNSNTDLDFKWVADASGIPATIFDAKGDIIAATAADTADRLAVGSNGQVLTADSTTATGLKWASPTAAATSWTLINSGGTALTGAQTITVSSISGYDKFFIYFTGASSASAQSEFRIRFNGDTANNYQEFGLALNHLATYSTSLIDFENDTGRSSFRMVQMTTSATNITSGYLLVTGGNTSGIKQLNGVGAAQGGGSGAKSYAVGGFWNNSATISSISINSEFGNFDAGTLYIYGAQ